MAKQNIPDVTAHLKAYEALLAKWNGAYNLIAPSTVSTIWERHIEDSLQLLPFLPQAETTIMDIGSGAGLPGLVLSIAALQHHYHLVEPVHKKHQFLKQVARELALDNVEIHAKRVEDMRHVKPDIITARALAPLPKLLEMIAPFACRALLLKGEQYEQELTAARTQWQFDCTTHKAGQGVILDINAIGRKL